MNRLNFPISAAILSILILSQYDHALGSHNTEPDLDNRYKHDAVVIHKTNETYGFYCSGTIISDLHVLTAASCVCDIDTRDVRDISNYLMEVTVGIGKLHNRSVETVRVVETIFLPYRFFKKFDPRYDMGERYGDIAVLKLNEKLGLSTNSRIEALALPENRGDPGYAKRPLTATGFGLVGYEKRRNENEISPIYPQFLHYSSAIVVDDDHCTYNSSTSNVKLCVQLINDKNLNTGNCWGDRGGALFDATNNELIGIASTYSAFCNDTQYFGTYTRVVAFVDIIEAAVNHDTAIPCKSRRKSFKDNQSYREKVKDERYSKFYSDINPYRRPIPDKLPSRRDTLPPSTYNG